MYQMTDNERQNLKQSILDLLDEYEYTYTDFAINKIIDTWCTNKSALLEAFTKHPNYVDGKFMIAFQSDYEREIDVSKIRLFYEWMKQRMRDPEYYKNLPEAVEKAKEMKHQYLPNDAFYFISDYLRYWTFRQITSEQAKMINEAFPEIKAHTNEKTTRVINRLCTYLNWHTHPDYNREFAKYADALTPITIKRHTILSLNPLDYLTMSFGNSWSSCHTIDKLNRRDMPNSYEGMYSSGTMSYMLDGTSMVLYTVDSSYDGDEFYTQPKINRQMFHFANDKLIQSRLYPQSNDSNNEAYTPYRNLVQEIISTIFDVPNIWTKKNGGITRYTISYGTHYRDYTCFDACNISILKDSNNDEPILIGHNPICIECGTEHDCASNINCCRGVHTCADCGCVIDDDEDIYWIDGQPYCGDCVAYCECCGHDHLYRDCTYIDGYGYVCDDCLADEFTCCDECGEWTHNDEITEINVNGRYICVCDSCLDNYQQCDNCGRWFSTSDLTEHDNGDSYCDECFEKIEEEEETEED